MTVRGGRPSVLFWCHGPDWPSFRHRIGCVVPELERRGWRCHVETIPKKRYLVRVLERRRQLRSFDVLLLHRIKPSPPEWPLLRRLSGRIVFDFDDAVYYRRPRRLGDEPERSWFRRYKFAQTCAASDLVLAGNRTLADAARHSARRVEIVPTTVDLESYERATPSGRDPHTIVWIGLPENVAYLELVRPVLARLARDYPALRLRVVSSRFPAWSDVPLEPVQWTAATEVATLRTAGVGIMPLTDDDWARGKCAYKLLQYMAAGLPCVGSAVGANLDALGNGRAGFLAADETAWERSLRALLDDPVLAERMGRAGRERVRERYDRRVVVPRVADLLEGVYREPRSTR